MISTPVPSTTVDPLLREIFGSEEDTTAAPLKSKPVFADGMKLDNSVDWDKVKVKVPPRELVVAQPETSTSKVINNTGPSIKEIFDLIDGGKEKDKEAVTDELKEIFEAERASGILQSW